MKELKPCNLLVLGVGIHSLSDESPQFDVQFPNDDDPFRVFRTSSDLPEICDYILFRDKLLDFTDGQVNTFPFVTLLQDLLDPRNKIDLTDLKAYLSSKEFISSEARRIC
jgi:hypothetical protein